MGIRETLEQHRLMAVGAVIVAVILAGWSTFNSLGLASHPPLKYAYYTTDDGKTWYTDDFDLYPPFQKDGKDVLQAHVMMNDDCSKSFCAYLSRYLPEGKRIKEAYRDQSKTGVVDPIIAQKVANAVFLQEFKLPGSTKWSRTQPPQMQKGPDGAMYIETYP